MPPLPLRLPLGRPGLRCLTAARESGSIIQSRPYCSAAIRPAAMSWRTRTAPTPSRRAASVVVIIALLRSMTGNHTSGKA